MKHIRSIVGALVLTAVFCTNVNAVPMWGYDDVKWRSTGSTSTFKCGNVGVAADGGYCDSAVKNVAVAAGTYHYDTTAVINMEDWTSAPPVYSDSVAFGTSGAAANPSQDTLVFAAFYFYPSPGGTVTASMDTIYLTAQVSNDAYNWLNWATPVQAFISSPAGGHSNGIAALEVGTDGGAYVEFPQYPLASTTTGAAGISSAAATNPSQGRLFGGWRFIRFIVINDNSGSFRCRVGRWKEVLGVVKMKSDRIGWQSRGLYSGLDGPIKRYESGTQGVEDSSWVTHASSRVDTSAAISTEGWTYNDIWNMKAGVVSSDSLFFGQMVYVPRLNNDLNFSFTSTLVETQVSLNGKDWLGGAKISAAEPSGTAGSFLYLKAGSGRASSGSVVRYPAGPRMPLSGTAPLRSQLFGFPFIRFLVTADVNGSFEGYIKRWQVVPYSPSGDSQ